MIASATVKAATQPAHTSCLTFMRSVRVRAADSEHWWLSQDSTYTHTGLHCQVNWVVCWEPAAPHWLWNTKRPRDPKNGLSIAAAQPTLFPAVSFPHPDTEICILNIFAFSLPNLLSSSSSFEALCSFASASARCFARIQDQDEGEGGLTLNPFVFVLLFTSFIYQPTVKSLHLSVLGYFRKKSNFSGISLLKHCCDNANAFLACYSNINMDVAEPCLKNPIEKCR